ncbi:MAG: PEP-CTERM sorting domain-containing protein [Planctomycetota bacterium]
MRLNSRNLALAAAGLMFGAGTAHAAVFNNSSGDGLWSNANNWANGDIADSVGETAQINPSAAQVDANFTIGRLQNSFGTQTQTISGAGVLTVDAGTANAVDAIVNVRGATGGTITIDTGVTVNNGGGGITRMRNSNSSANVLAMGPSSTLNLATAAEVVQGAGGSVQFNGALAGTAALRFSHNNVSFGATSDSPNYAGELVFLNNANVTADTAGGNTFFGGQKFQVNGNASLTINNAGVLANTPNVALAGTPTFNLNVNGNQAFGNLILNNGAVNLTLGAGVTDVDFLPSGAFAWNGSLNIDNFAPGIVGFGFDGGLSAAQLDLITVDGAAPVNPLTLDSEGKLVFVPEPGSLALLAGGWGLIAFRRRPS